MTYFVKNEDKIIMVEGESITPHIPMGCYALTNDSRVGLHLKEVEYPALPDPLFGDLEAITKQIHTAFAVRPGSLGVLFSGVSGAGKTIQLKHVIHQRKYPTVLVQAAWDSPDVLTFFSKLPPCYIVLDEWDKIYTTREERNFILQLLEGSGSMRHIILMSSNEASPGDFLQYRPGRIRYHFKYDALPREIMVQFVSAFAPAERVSEIQEFVGKHPDFSLDCVKALCEESAISTLPVSRIVDYLNVGAPPIEYKWDLTFRAACLRSSEEKDSVGLCERLGAVCGELGSSLRAMVDGKDTKLFIVSWDLEESSLPPNVLLRTYSLRNMFDIRVDLEELEENNKLHIDGINLPVDIRGVVSYVQLRPGEIQNVCYENGKRLIETKYLKLEGTPFKSRWSSYM